MAKLNLFQHAARALAELFTQPDPYPEKYASARVTGNYLDKAGNEVLVVSAANYREAARVTDGQTPAGNFHKEIVRVGHNKWEIRVVKNQTMDPEEYQKQLDARRW